MTNSAEIHALRCHLEAHLERHLALLESCVGVNSFTRNAAGVNEVGRRTTAALAPLGFRADVQPSVRPDVGGHLFLTRPGRSARTVALVSHLDTVYTAEEERANDFRFRKDGDKLYGPGVGDIKGGTVLALMVLDALARVAPREFDEVTWQVGLNAAEEILEPEFSNLFRRRLGDGTLAVLVVEGGTPRGAEWPLVVARKGRAQFRVGVRGRGAHPGIDFWDGRNAAVAAARLALELDRLSDRAGERTVNVGRLEAGTVVNRVPHAAVVEGEVRAFAPEVLAEGLAGARRAAAALAAEGYAAALAVAEEVAPWPSNQATDRLFALWEAAGAALGRRVTRQARGGLSDGNFFWRDYPTLDGLGPVGANYHCSEQAADGSKEQEYVLRSSFVPKAQLSCTALLGLLRAGGG